MVVVLSRMIAEEYWPDGGALGRRIRLGAREGQGEWLTMVGVAEDVRHPLDPKAARILYRPVAQAPTPFASLLVQTGSDPEALRGSVEKAVWTLDDEMNLWGAAPLGEMLTEQLEHVRFTTTLVTLFAALAVGLAVLGVLGCSAYAVGRQSREFGVRMALGAQIGQVSRLVMRESLQLTALGLVLGITASLLVNRMLSALLFGVGPNDVVTLATVSALLLGIALTASAVPARRASRVDPIEMAHRP